MKITSHTVDLQRRIAACAVKHDLMASIYPTPDEVIINNMRAAFIEFQRVMTRAQIRVRLLANAVRRARKSHAARAAEAIEAGAMIYMDEFGHWRNTPAGRA